MLDTIISIILFILAFGILICIHEAGHLSMAKLFNVYCKEYSIGFGPAIYSTKKKEGRETKFSIRWIPFGGYVSMYGEGSENDPEFDGIPFERSIEGIKKWKKAIILSAGVILNAILAFILIFISNFAFPTVFYTRQARIEESSLIASEGVKTGDHLTFYIPSFYKDEDGSIAPFGYEFSDDEKIIHSNTFFIVDTDVTFGEGTEHYVLTFMYDGNKKEPVFSDGLLFYHAVHRSELATAFVHNTQLQKDLIAWSEEDGSPDYYPNFEGGAYLSETDFKFTANLKFEEYETPKDVEINVKSSKKGAKITNTFDNIGLSFMRSKEWLPAKERFRNTFIDYGSAAGAVFKGLKVLFTGGIRNMSGIVGIFDASASLYTQYTFSTYLFFWGLISVNLAIFNLLPFPGLDGWQLLVTAIEGITRKKIPPKVKNIVSIVGIGLLFLLMGAIIVLDILRLVGI